MVKVLCVDDDRNFCDLLVSYFDVERVDVAVVHEVATAIERIYSEEFSLLLLDLELPDGSGLDVARAVSSSNSQSHPVVALITDKKISTEEYIAIKSEFSIDYIVAKSHFDELAFPFFTKICETVGEPLLKMV